MTWSLRWRAVLGVVGGVLLVGACSEPPARPAEVPPVADGSTAGVVDWDGREVSLEYPGWELSFCEGDGPFLCVVRGGEPVGAVELLRLPVQDHPVISGVLERGGSEQEALETAAAEFVATLSADRQIGFGEAHHLDADAPATANVMGKAGIRLIATGRLGDRIEERAIQYHVIHGDTLYLLAAMGGSDPYAGNFTLVDLEAFEPAFAEIAAVSRVSGSNDHGDDR
jgi:hypothetical protein